MIMTALTRIRRRTEAAPALLWPHKQPQLQVAGPALPALLMAAGDEKETIRADRRRPSGPSDGQPRERAEAPKRRRADGSGGSSGGGGGGNAPRPPQGPQKTPNLMTLLIGGGVLLLLLIFGGPSLLFQGAQEMVDNGQVPPAVQQAAQQQLPAAGSSAPVGVTPTVALESLAIADTSGEGDTWLVMLYQDADDKVLEQDIYVDLNEAERIGSSDKVHIVAQVDRYRAGYQGDGNWSETKRFYITQDDDLQKVHSQEIANLGELNMADGQTLIDFVTWAVENFPADKHVLIMSDHGMGWPGGWSDPEPQGSVDRSVPLQAALGDQLYLSELDDALQVIRDQTGLDKFELIGMDACLMGHLEVFDALRPHARYAVASQETEPALGWAYTGFLGELLKNPGVTGAELGRYIVSSYIGEDQRIVDDQARAEMTSRGNMSGLFGLAAGPTAQQLARQMEANITLTAIDLQKLPALLDSVNELAFTLQSSDQKRVARARSYAQSFTSIFGSNVPPSYIDLGNFMGLLKREVGGSQVNAAADRVLSTMQDALIAERHGPNKPGATGVSVYFPNSQLFSSPVAGPASYTVVAERFAQDTLWDDFLTYHYTGRKFQATANQLAVPQRGETVIAPGAGAISVSPVTLSANVAAPGQPVLLSADISGENVGYVYLFVGYLDQESNSIFVADMDYLESPETRELNGVYYPEWTDGTEFTLEFEWEPLMFAMSNGDESALALFEPEEYGADAAGAVYTVEGIYAFADGDEPRYARAYFADGWLQHVFTFTNSGGTGAAREVIPSPGDSFTILQKWMDLDAQGNIVAVEQQTGDTLVFNQETLSWQELDAAVGEYVIGYIVEDLDGNSKSTYATISVE